MATTIKLKNSVTTTNTPSSLAQGEVAINITDKKVWVGNAATTPVQLLGDGGSVSFTSISLSGNLTFTGTGNRITGDFSNATLVNRLMFQTSTTNTTSVVGVIPNGTAVISRLAVFNNSDPTNAAQGDISVNSAEVQVRSLATGTGTALPLTMYTNGSERLRIDTNGNVGIGANSIASNTKLLVSGGRTNLVANSDAFALGVGYASAGAYYLGANSSNNALIFSNSAGSEVVRFDSSGNVGIGTSSASHRLHVYDASNATVSYVNSGQTSVYLRFGNSASQTGYIGYEGTGGTNMTFYTASTERMRIDSSGNLLVGTTSLSFAERLSVKSAGTSSASDGVFICNSAGTALFRVRSDGAFQTGAAAVSPYNNTTGSAANTFVNTDGTLLRSTSSLKYKKDVKDATHGLTDLLKLRSVTYKGKNEADGEKTFGGLIAEEVHEAGLTEFVHYSTDGSPDALNYGNMVSLLAKAIQELNAKVDAQAAEIALLKSK